MKIDFVSDVSCPWCAIGLASLETALERLGPEVPVTLHFQPFELNPGMAPEGEDTNEHIARKYGMPEEQVMKNREAIRQRGAAVGFTFNMDKRSRIYNTFDAHRLLHWAGSEGKQVALKLALLKAYHADGRDPSDHGVLIDAAASVGLDAAQAGEVLATGKFADEVRAEEHEYQALGIQSVPAVIFNQRYLVSGGQPVAVFEQAIRQIIAETE
jgi:predicted DsbA family dithiol-disulfide isomerase